MGILETVVNYDRLHKAGGNAQRIAFPLRPPRAHCGQHVRPARWNRIMALTAEHRRLDDARKRYRTDVNATDPQPAWPAAESRRSRS
jgi:hypothetical protein